MNRTLTSGSEAWRLLNGLVCLYKPPGVLPGTAMKMLRFNLSKNLNEMEQSDLSMVNDNCYSGLSMIETKDQQNLKLSSRTNKPPQLSQGREERDQDGLELCENRGSKDGVDNNVFNRQLAKLKVETHSSIVDYSSHPLVLGPGFEEDDIKTYAANTVATRSSGVMVVGVNKGVYQAKALQRSKPLVTYQVWGEWGRATDTGFKDGKTVSKSTWKHVGYNPWVLDQALSNIQASHQRQAWRSTETNLQSQEAYKLAVQGPVRPANPSDTIIYSIKCLDWKPPEFMLEVKCIADDLYFIMDLISEIGVKCSTNAMCNKVRVSQVAMFNADHCLLRKHWRLQHVLENMSDCRSIVKAFGGINPSPTFKKDVQAGNVADTPHREQTILRTAKRFGKIVI